MYPKKKLDWGSQKYRQSRIVIEKYRLSKKKQYIDIERLWHKIYQQNLWKNSFYSFVNYLFWYVFLRRVSTDVQPIWTAYLRNIPNTQTVYLFCFSTWYIWRYDFHEKKTFLENCFQREKTKYAFQFTWKKKYLYSYKKHYYKLLWTEITVKI